MIRQKKIWLQVLPGFEPGLLDSKSRVITNYTIEPVLLRTKICRIPDGIRTRNLKIRSLTPYPLGHGDNFMWHCDDRFFFEARVCMHTQNFFMRMLRDKNYADWQNFLWSRRKIYTQVRRKIITLHKNLCAWMTYEEQKIISTPAGFEPARAEPNSLAGCRLNHSAKVSVKIFMYPPRRGIEPRASAWQAEMLPTTPSRNCCYETNTLRKKCIRRVARIFMRTTLRKKCIRRVIFSRVFIPDKTCVIQKIFSYAAVLKIHAWQNECTYAELRNLYVNDAAKKIFIRAHDRDRTCDRWLIRPMLYRLSYASWYT